ncbi:MAG: MCE family protein [Bacteroidales bacterium]|nr:MCE family protein [Bacteroidales bacterium]
MKLSRELKIGIVAIITIALLIWGINFLKGIDIFKSSDTYYSLYDNIGGLIESGVIYLNGFRIGNVSEIKYDSQSARIIVRYSIKERVKIPENSVFQIYSSSLVSGIKDIRLVLGEGTGYYQSGDTVPGELDRGLEAVIDPIREQTMITISKIDTVIGSLARILNEDKVEEIQQSIGHIDNIAASLDNNLSEGGPLDSSFDNLASITENIKQSNHELKAVISNFRNVSDSVSNSQLKSAIANANATLQSTSGILAKVEAGEGTLGMLVHNDSLYIHLKNVTETLDLLLNDLREHPKRYVHFSLFGKKEKAEN